MIEAITTLMMEGKWSEAKVKSQELVREHPTLAAAHAYLGLCFYRENDFNKAAPCFERACILDPHYWEAGLKWAQALDRLQRFEEAYEVASKFVKEQPNDPHLNALVHGLSRHAKGNRTDGWEISKQPMYHIVESTHRD